MNSILGPSRLEHKTLRRCLAVLLLFSMASDLGYHLAEPFLAWPDNPAGALLRASIENPEPPGGCGVPGHHGTPFHHHHFPTVISQTPPPVPLLALTRISTASNEEFVHTSGITPIGRAPPARF